jgi:phage gp16-like protein
MNVPGTEFPFPVYERKDPPRLLTDRETKQRNGLLAKIHVAKKQMGLNDGEYEMILKSFKVSTAADMTILQLEQMVKLLKHYGWKEIKTDRGQRSEARDLQLIALRARCVEAAAGLENGEKRLAGLAEKICGTAQLIWCQDARKLERLLAVIAEIVKREA